MQRNNMTNSKSAALLDLLQIVGRHADRNEPPYSLDKARAVLQAINLDDMIALINSYDARTFCKEFPAVEAGIDNMMDSIEAHQARTNQQLMQNNEHDAHHPVPKRPFINYYNRNENGFIHNENRFINSNETGRFINPNKTSRRLNNCNETRFINRRNERRFFNRRNEKVFIKRNDNQENHFFREQKQYGIQFYCSQLFFR